MLHCRRITMELLGIIGIVVVRTNDEKNIFCLICEYFCKGITFDVSHSTETRNRKERELKDTQNDKLEASV